MNRRSALSLAFFVLLAFAAAALGGLFPPGEWYAGLSKPDWTPPNWLFGPVWTALYLMIGIAGWLLWQRRQAARGALILWAAQLLLNASWSAVFFGLEAPGAAFAVIVLLLAAILATIGAAWNTCRAAAWLLVPYAAWVSFATALNGAIRNLN